MVWEILLAILSVIGLAACVRFVLGLLVYPIRDALILIPAQGDGRALEHQLRALQLLSDEGKLTGQRVFLADCGLDEEGVALAQRLCQTYPGVQLCVITEEPPHERK